MFGLPPRLIYGLTTLVVGIVMIQIWVKGDNNLPELPPQLAAVQCLNAPVNEEHAKRNRALVRFKDYAFYDVCIHKDLVTKKHLLRCDLSYTTPLCDDTAELSRFYTRKKDDTIVVGSFWDERLINESKSSVEYRFSQSGFKPFEGGKYTTIKKDDVRFPSKFTPLKDITCSKMELGRETRTHVLCSSYVSFNSVDVLVMVDLLDEADTKIKDSRIIEDMEFWLEFLNAKLIAYNGQ